MRQAKINGQTHIPAVPSCPLCVCAKVQEARNNPLKFVRKGFSLASVTRNEELLRPAAADRSTRFVELDISGDSSLG